MTNKMSEAKQIAIAILPKFSGFFSLIGSGFIVYDILCNHFNIEPDWCKKKKDDQIGSSSGFSRRTAGMSSAKARSSRRFAQRKNLKNSAYYRLMLAMSVSDFIVSGAWFCTTWPIPRDELSLDNPSESVYGNIGTQGTCTAQAFFIQLGIITPFYNALLALYYYLTIRREWKEEDFKCRIEYAGHFVTVAWGVSTSVAGLAMELFNNSVVWCWIAPYPLGCGDGKDQEPCVRGKNALIMRWVFYYGPLWVMIALVALFMSLVYAYVRGLDSKMDQYTATYRAGAARNASNTTSNSDQGSGEAGNRRNMMSRTFSTMNTDVINQQRQQNRNERSKAVASQGLFYAGTFALVWVCGTVVRALQLAEVKAPWWLIFLFGTSFFNSWNRSDHMPWETFYNQRLLLTTFFLYDFLYSITAVLTPSQGFFNFLVYVRPRLIKKLEERKRKKEVERNSKLGSFNSEILRVSGISNNSSSEHTGTRNDSNRSGVELSDPFQSSKEFQGKRTIRGSQSSEFRKSQSSEFRSSTASSELSPVEDPFGFSPGPVVTEIQTPEPKTVKRRSGGTPGFGRVRNRAAGRNSPGSPKPDFHSSKVRFSASDIDISTATRRRSKTVGFAADDISIESEATIDSDLVNDANVDRKQSPRAKGKGSGLHNATIDFATGAVRTRNATRIVSPPSYD